MRGLIIVICIAGLVLCGALSFSGHILAAILIGIAIAAAVIMLAIIKQSSNHDVRAGLMDADEGSMFSVETHVLSEAWKSVILKEDFFFQYDEDSSVRKTYMLIRDRIDRNIASSKRFISAYDYHLRPEPVYLRKLVVETKGLVRKLSELSDLCIQIDDSATDVDISYADDMLRSLEQILKEDI